LTEDLASAKRKPNKIHPHENGDPSYSSLDPRFREDGDDKKMKMTKNEAGIKMKISFWKQSLNQALKSYFTKETGGVALLTALLLTTCAGFAGFAIDVGLWYSQKRQLQLAADAGAIGGVLALTKTGTSATTTYATYDIGLNGCTSTNNCTIVAINNPPASGTYAGNTNAVEVILSKPAQLYLTGLFFSSSPTIRVRSVALAAAPASCMSLLGSGSIPGELTISNGANVSATSSCGTSVNSSSSTALQVSGGAQLNTQKVTIVGNYSVSGGASINTTPPNNIVTGAPSISDPFSNFTIPSFSACSSSINIGGGQTTSINPGSYCNVNIGNGATVTMNPGTYFIDGGSFNLNGGATVTGNGVTVILTSSTGSSFGTISIGNGTTPTLTAPSSGPTAGFLFIVDRRAANLTNTFSGGTNQKYSGIMYMPTVGVSFSNGSSTTGCVQLVAFRASFTGGTTYIGQNCVGSGTGAGSSNPKLAE
jgi:Flp pilus assembly protein TadG